MTRPVQQRRASAAAPPPTLAEQLVLSMLIARHPEEMFGRQLALLTGQHPVTTYAILRRLERRHGLVTARGEDTDPATAGRPPRRYYRLTEDGLIAARAALATVRPPRP